MTSYIQFPRYCLFLIPDKKFNNDFDVFCDQNLIENSLLDKSTYGFHSTVKAPFYLSHLYSEELLLEKFQNIDKKSGKVCSFSSMCSSNECFAVA